MIQRAATREITGYFERHHIVPRCVGGTDGRDNLVNLTPEEHYLAHQILVKLYPGHSGIAWAAIAMTAPGLGNKLYGWLRRRYSESRKGQPREWMLGENNPAKRPGVGEKIAASRRGKKRPPFSPAWIANMTASRKAAAARPGYVPIGQRPGVGEKIAKAFRGRRWITDGLRDVIVHVSGELPAGWRFGRTRS